MLHKGVMLYKQNPLVAKRILQHGNVQLVGRGGTCHPSAERRRVQQHLLARYLRHHFLHLPTGAIQEGFVEELIGTAYAQRPNNAGLILQHHGLFVSPYHFGTAYRYQRKVLVKRVAQQLLAASAELQISSAHAPFLERAARMP